MVIYAVGCIGETVPILTLGILHFYNVRILLRKMFILQICKIPKHYRNFKAHRPFSEEYPNLELPNKEATSHGSNTLNH